MYKNKKITVEMLIQLKRIIASETDLLQMVRMFSEDQVNNTIEFNEFLKMMAKQENDEIDKKELIEAFK